jgi:3-hydroxyisobutyrate dehydrogenase
MSSDERDGQAIGFIGLGNMGLPMARRLVAAGYQVRGFDPAEKAMRDFGRSAEGPGEALAAADPAAAGAGAGAVILMLPDSNVVESVVLGQLAGLPPGSTIIDMSSSDPARTRALAQRLAAAGVTLIDAPVSGGVGGAQAGTLTVMVGGPDAAYERFKPVLSAMGSRVMHAGGTGCGHAVKALNNLMSAANLLVASEALIAGQRFGLDPAVMLDIINGSSGRSNATENKWPNFVLPEKFEAGFAVRLMVKDIKLALALEQAGGVPSSASEAVVAVWEAAMPEIPADADHTAIARWLTEQQ